MRPRIDDDEAVVDVATLRRALERVYRRSGVKGVVDLLPGGVKGVLGLLPGRRKEAWAPRQDGSGSGVWDWLRATMSNPDVILFLIAVAFAVLVFWDSARGAPSPPSLASLHMSPFPLGTSAM